MNNFHYIFLLLLSFNSVASVDDITGAFGLKLGGVVPKGVNCNLIKEHISINCNLMPPKPFISFDKYRISVTRIDGVYRIYAINGNKYKGKDYIRCLNEAELIAKKIEKKYSIKFIREPIMIYKSKKRQGAVWETPINKKKKNIFISCSNVELFSLDDSNSNYKLSITYEDPSIFERAVWDNVNMKEIKNSDDSGL